MPIITPIEPHQVEAFVDMQRHWLITFDLYEPADDIELVDPIATYVAGGGAIYVAVDGDAVVGGCAIAPAGGASLEICRFAVVPEMQGRGIGRRLLETCLEHARRGGASRVVLTTNSALARALKLYEAAGFRYAPMPESVARKYRTANAFMILDLAR